MDPVSGMPHKIPSIVYKAMEWIKHSKKYKSHSPENPSMVNCHYLLTQSNPSMVSIIFLILKERTALSEKVGNLPKVTQ